MTFSEHRASLFWAKVDKTGPGGCWLWTGAHIPNGYGQFWSAGEAPSTLAHRIAYEEIVGPIPSGLEVDHLCRVRDCVNPAHLEPVTKSENLRRGVWINHPGGTKALCVRGHDLNDPTIARPKPSSRAKRFCLACNRERDREYRQRKKAARC